MKNLKYFALVVFSLTLLNCNTDFGYNFKILSDLREEYKFNYVEFSESAESITFTLQDIDHDFIEHTDLKSYSMKIDKFIRTKYSKTNKYKRRNYIFSGSAGIEIVKFEINNSGEVINTTKL